MASSKEYLDFIMDQLSDLEDVKVRAMMGEFMCNLLRAMFDELPAQKK